ncbi:MAG: siderophore-interacting protein [Pseudonocardia sp.]|nr:siderophore-interacting protein [Pseudonocardia sp.]
MARRTTTLEVRRTERLTPHMIRVVAGGGDIAGFPDTPHTDRYVKILFPRPGVAYPEPFAMETAQELPREQRPAIRTLTVRSFDPDAGELVIDVVHHGAEGLAGPWAAAARPGDPLWLMGPGGDYEPDPGADWHLLVGDESALPAIGAALERIPAGGPALAVVEVGGPEDELSLRCAGALDLRWCHRAGARPDQLVEVVAAAEFPPGRVHAFVHGEAGSVRAVRRHLLAERGIPRSDLSVSGYWRRGRDEDGWTSDKRAERAADEAAATAEEQAGRAASTR